MIGDGGEDMEYTTMPDLMKKLWKAAGKAPRKVEERNRQSLSDPASRGSSGGHREQAGVGAMSRSKVCG